MESKKICKFYMSGECKKGENCDFLHNPNFCKHFYNNKCKYGNKCKFSHEFTPLKKNKKHRKKKNTQSFDPDHSPPDMKVTISLNKEKYQGVMKENEVVIVPNLFEDENIYQKLLEEIKVTGSTDEIWKLWHGDSHFIADDKRNGWKDKCPTFSYVINKVKNYFEMDVKATRFNWYRNNEDWKPYHHDAAAVDPRKAKTQNFTAAVSFGVTRVGSFQHAKTKTRVDFPLPNGSIYTFAKQVNIDWMHGIPQELEKNDQGRISIILWGKNKQIN